MNWNINYYCNDERFGLSQKLHKSNDPCFAKWSEIYYPLPYEFNSKSGKAVQNILLLMKESKANNVYSEIYSSNKEDIFVWHKKYADLCGVCCGLKAFANIDKAQEVVDYFINVLMKNEYNYCSFLVNPNDNIDCFIEFVNEQIDINNICSEFAKQFPDVKMTGVKSQKGRYVDFEVYFSEKGNKKIKTGKVKYDRSADSTYINLTKNKYWADYTWNR